MINNEVLFKKKIQKDPKQAIKSIKNYGLSVLIKTRSLVFVGNKKQKN